MLITAAYTHQFHTLGWYNFCLGRISSKWHEAVRACLSPSTPFHHLQWGSLLISALWKFTKTLWQHQNGLVHGSEAAENAQRILTGLRDQVRQHYQSYEADNTYVLARHRFLFASRTLNQRLSLLYDYTACWLHSIEDARLQMVLYEVSQRASAAHFFGPPPTPTPFQSTGEISEQDSDDSYNPLSLSDTISTSLATHQMITTVGSYVSHAGSWSDSSTTINYAFSELSAAPSDSEDDSLQGLSG
jgi:hypothetical protein